MFSDHAEFRNLLNQITASKVDSCIIDLSKLQSIDSSGLGMFIVAFRNGKKERLVADPAPPRAT
ncbi:STAS domain-containing protein [Breoghania sp.]|uniref:STAS domain-containing protein n=1 Tax=Breoghania sp. TaxID=2065378 RepID=UPI0026056C2D|nr:STAS domain-containing protein [Breoghania sp.]